MEKLGENLSDEEYKLMMNTCDLDSDGKLTFDEFYKLVDKNA